MSIVISIGIVFLIQKLHLFGADSYWLPGEVYAVRDKAIMPLLEIVLNILQFPPGCTGGFNGPLWSLSYEIFYYGLFGLGMSVLYGKKYFWVSLTGFFSLFALVIGYTAINKGYSGTLISVLVLSVVWAMGARLALSVIKGNFIVSKISLGGYLAFGVICQWAGLVHQGTIKSLGYGLVSYFVIAGVLSLKRTYKPSRFFARGSRYTYTMYLIHFPIFMLILSLVGIHLSSFGVMGHAVLFIISIGVIHLLSSQAAYILEPSNRDKGYSVWKSLRRRGAPKFFGP